MLQTARMTQTALREAMEQKGFASFRKLADALHRNKPKLKDLPEAHSLATYLGKLDKGDVGWFEKRGHIFDAICALLEVDREQLLPKKAVSPVLHTFDAFPELRPLDLCTEDPVNLLDPSLCSADPLFGLPSPFSLFLPDSVGEDAARASWIVAPRGTGARLWADACAARGLAACVRVQYLADALEQTPRDTRRIILVQEAQPERDIDACERLAQSPQTTVIAPFVHPALLQWESHNGPATDRGFQTQPMRLPKWFVWTWTLRSDWRKQFLDWIAARLHRVESLFDAEKMLEWLHKIDPRHVLFPTPHDLLPLCARLHREGPRKLTQLTPDQLADHLFAEAIRPFPKERDGSLWLSAHAQDLFRSMVDWKLRNLAVPFHAGLPKEKWLPAIPASQIPTRRTEPEMQRALKQLRGKKAKDREKAEAELIQKTTSPDPHEALQLLAEAGLLGTAERSGLTLRPAVCFVHWARKSASKTLRNDPPPTWGRWVLDSQRQDMIDQELDALSADALLGVVTKAVHSADPHDLGSVGALDALFAAVGRRLQDAPSFRTLAAQHTNTLHALWHEANQCRRRKGNRGELVPTVRMGLYWAGYTSFIADCWSWSFFLQPPKDKSVLHSQKAWLWPGWHRPCVSDVPGLSKTELSDGMLRENKVKTDFDRIAALVPLYLSRCDEPKSGVHFQSWLLPWLWLHGSEQGWPADLLEIRSRLDRRECILLLRLCRERPEHIQKAVATSIVAAALAPGSQNLALQTYRDESPDFFQFLLRSTDWDSVVTTFDPSAADVLLPFLVELPESVWSWVLDTVSTNRSWSEDRILSRASSQKDKYPSQSFREMLKQVMLGIALSREGLSFVFPQRCYRHSASDALEVALALWKKQPLAKSTQYWFTESPHTMSIRGPLVDCLRDLESAERPEWVTRFLLTTLPIAGDRADEVFRLATQ
jgi:hypothetical protein